MPIGIDPKVDFAFKLVFGSPDHTSITKHFLNAVLNLPQPITEVEILNPIQGKDRSEDKLVVLDVLAQDRLGSKFNIEMQTTIPLELPERLTYYNSLNFVRQIGPGDNYYQIRPAISICVLSQNLFPEVEPYHLSFRLRCDQESLVFSDALEFHTLELAKFRVSSDNPKYWSAVEKWLYFLLHAEQMEADELASRLAEPAYEEAIGVLSMISRSPEERQFYEARQKFLQDERARILFARQEGLREGRQEGRQEGLQEGRQEGLEEGKLIGKVQMLEEMLGNPSADSSDLARLGRAALTTRLADLQTQLRGRQS
ncbi:MAG: Rpn family recombination-promoting nuclease/putative transposase [Planctomycetota bacterium]